MRESGCRRVVVDRNRAEVLERRFTEEVGKGCDCLASDAEADRKTDHYIANNSGFLF